MADVRDHYAEHLAPIYVWMAGGIDAAVTAGAQDVAAFLPGQGLAVDLGAGFGMHSIPLARAGYEVLAIDTSSALLETLRAAGAGLPIRAVGHDLLRFGDVLPAPARLIVCMGDTLTHLQDFAQVQALCADIRRALAPGGHFVATFRDYSTPARDDARFVPVRSDADRILTCFVEAEPLHVKVHDLVHERGHAGWTLKVGSYRKLRLAPAALEATLRGLGLSVHTGPGPRGMVRVHARALD